MTTFSTPQATEPRQFLLDTYQALLGEMVRGSSLEVLAEKAAERLGRPVIIEDVRLVPLASHFPNEGLGRGVNIFQEIEQLSKSETLKRVKLDRRVKQIDLNLDEEKGERLSALVAPVFVEDQLCGYVFFLGCQETSTEMALCECTAQVAGVEMRRLKTKITTEQKLGKVFLKELLSADTSKANELYRKARYLGYTLADGYMMVVATVEADPDTDPQAINKFQQRLVKDLYRVTGGMGLIHYQGDAIMLFFPITTSASPGECKRFAEQVVQLGQMYQLKVSVGVGGMHMGLEGIPKSFQEAQQAIRVSRLWGNGHLTFYDELETYQLLLQSTEHLDLSKVSLGPLDQLVEYDKRTNSELTKTLEVYLQCNGNITKATKALHIHRNTMKYRLEKIVDLTNIDLDNAEQRFELQLNLKINKMRHAQASLRI